MDRADELTFLRWFYDNCNFGCGYTREWLEKEFEKETGKLVPLRYTYCKSIEEWSQEHGVIILDPDGFDRSDPFLHKQLFSEKEFFEGLKGSTIQITTDASWKVKDFVNGLMNG